MGAITAVAVWDHQPTGDELLALRLKQGWVPTPSRLKDGHQVLGHAAGCYHPSPSFDPAEDT
ncbi:MAG TPA: hypothetical protein PLS70_10150 [Acidobacteriota bacterium]|nr:hypothetical protein [Acidobacteriota bacterium]